MIEFVSLNSIITDLLNIIRQSQISQSEPISKRQLEGWIHQYRAMLIKRDLDKGKVPNPDYIQTINGLQMSAIDNASFITGVTMYEGVMRSDLQIPKTLDFNFKSGLLFVGTVDGHEFMLVPEGRRHWQQYKKYTSSDPIVFLRDQYLYLVGNENLPKYLTVRGIFEIPTEVINFTNPVTSQDNYVLNQEYPIPIDKVPVLKEMILKGELGIEYRAWSDVTEDSRHKVEPNVEGQPQQDK